MKIRGSGLAFGGATHGIGVGGGILVACSLAFAGGAGVIVSDNPAMSPTVVFVVGKRAGSSTVHWWGLVILVNCIKVVHGGRKLLGQDLVAVGDGLERCAVRCGGGGKECQGFRNAAIFLVFFLGWVGFQSEVAIALATGSDGALAVESGLGRKNKRFESRPGFVGNGFLVPFLEFVGIEAGGKD